MEVLKNHEYLGYFPHYEATLSVAQLAKKVQKYNQFLEIIQNKPLIKIDNQTTKSLLELATEWNEFEKLSKILISRFRSNILSGTTNQDLQAQVS